MSVTRPTLMGLPCASVVVVPPPAADVLLLLLPPPQPAARAERPTAAIATAAHRQRCLLNEPSLARVSGSVPGDPKPPGPSGSSRQRDPSGAIGRIGWPVTSAMIAKSRS